MSECPRLENRIGKDNTERILKVKTKIYGSDMRRYNVRTVALYSLIIVSREVGSKFKGQMRQGVLEKKGSTNCCFVVGGARGKVLRRGVCSVSE